MDTKYLEDDCGNGKEKDAEVLGSIVIRWLSLISLTSVKSSSSSLALGRILEYVIYANR